MGVFGERGCQVFCGVFFVGARDYLPAADWGRIGKADTGALHCATDGEAARRFGRDDVSHPKRMAFLGDVMIPLRGMTCLVGGIPGGKAVSVARRPRTAKNRGAMHGAPGKPQVLRLRCAPLRMTRLRYGRKTRRTGSGTRFLAIAGVGGGRLPFRPCRWGRRGRCRRPAGRRRRGRVWAGRRAP
jgi:hypothetical protein